MPEINGINLPFLPAGGVDALHNGQQTQKSSASKFSEIFQSELDQIKFSAHAKSRIKSRKMEMTNSDIQRLGSAFDSAKEKGAKDSLVMMDNKAFIINVPNKTVITAMDKGSMNSNVITNIDSAIVA